MKVTLKILLAAAVVLLVYMCYKSVTGPIEYDDQKTIRDNAIIARLIEIRKAQIEYKNMYKTHAGSFDAASSSSLAPAASFLVMATSSSRGLSRNS